MHAHYWLRFLKILLFVQHCNAVSFSINDNINNNIEGSGVCGCAFSCEAFRGSGAATCYIIYQEEGTWLQEEYQLANEEPLDHRECITGGIRQHCYMFVVYATHDVWLSCVDSHRECRRASGSIAKMDTNDELYDFSTILANNIPNDLQIYYSYKTIAGDIWTHNAALKNTCASVQSLSPYRSDIQTSGCRKTFEPVNSILCENTPLPINTYCAVNPTTLKSGQVTENPQPTAAVSRKVTNVLWPGGTPYAPKQFTNALHPNSNPGPELPHQGAPNLLPTRRPWGVTDSPTTQTKLKKKKMVVNQNEPDNTKEKNNVTHLVAGIFFVGTILTVGFALLVGCFFRNRHGEQLDRNRWSKSSDPPEILDLNRTYAGVDARNAASDYEYGYSVIQEDKRHGDYAVEKKLSRDDCRRHRLSKPASIAQKYHDRNSSGLHNQQDINERDMFTYKTHVRSYDVIDRMSSGKSTGSRSSAVYEIHDFDEYDYAYANNTHEMKSQYSDPYVIRGIQEPSYDYAYTSSKCVKNKTKSKRQRKKRDNILYGDV